MSVAVGLDIGSTWVKALALAPDGSQLGSVRRRTPWQSVGDGGTQMHAQDLMATVRELLDDLDAQLAGRRVGSIGISGMAEAGVLLDADGVPAVPIPAWFDPRGADEFAAQPAALRTEFPCVTGLPVSALATFAKLLHHRANGLDLRGQTWLNIPEYVAHLLGGDRLGEASLAARTGLVDQDTGRPWAPALDALGVGEELLPPIVTAGTDWGRASKVPASMRDAVLTVAGHDHLVASVAAGVIHPHQLYDSIGTAEALVRVLVRPLAAATRGALAEAGVNVVRHLLPGRSTMLAGTRAGLVLRRVLHLVGVSDEAGRAALDAAVMALPPDALGGIQVTGAANTSSTMTLRVDADDVSPAAAFAAALAHGTECLREVVALIDAQVGPATETVVAGGWAGMASVRRARQAALPGVCFSSRAEDTAYGAALVGRFAADADHHDLIQFVSSSLTPVPHP